MSISKYNNEGYPDPTAFGALSSIENETRALRAFRPIVYICSPFAGDAIMSKCSEIWVFGSHISPGMEAEIKRAKWKNYRLRYFTENLEEV